MRKRFIIVAVALAMALLSSFAFLPASSQASPSPVTCTGTYWGGTLGSVTVPSGEACTLFDSRVKGSVTAQPDSSLRMCGTTVTGSVTANQAYVNIDNSSVINGSLDINQSGAMEFKIILCGNMEGEGEYGAYVCPRLIGGSLIITNGPDNGLEDAVGECGPVNVHGSVRVIDNNHLVRIVNTTILGSLTCHNNWPPPQLYVWVTGSVHGDCFGSPL